MKRCQRCRVPLEGRVAAVLKKVLKITASKDNPDFCNKCRPAPKGGGYVCRICNRTVSEAHALAHVKAEEYLLGLIKKDHPEWKESDDTCPECIAYYRKLIDKTNI